MRRIGRAPALDLAPAARLTLNDVSRTYRVREFAIVTGLTTKALRHYDRVGLLRPHRTQTGYRVYRTDDLLRIEQIAALKLLGLSLRQIREVLQDGGLPLDEALLAQRGALLERRHQIDRALSAIDHARGAAASGGNDHTEVLAELMKALATARVDVLRKYFGDDAWVRWRSRHPSWPSADWIALYREAHAALDEDPAEPHAQELARRCIALFEAETDGDPAIRTALRSASGNHDEWIAFIQSAMPDVAVERVSRFLATAAWAKWDAPDGHRYDTPRVRPRASASATALMHEFAEALDEDPRGERVQQLLGRWGALLDEQCGNDSQTRDEMVRAAARWRNWPDGMRRWVAYTYDMSVGTWERVMTLMDAAQAA